MAAPNTQQTPPRITNSSHSQMVDILALVVQSNANLDFVPAEIANAISEDTLKHMTDTCERNNFMVTESFHIVALARIMVLQNAPDTSGKPIPQHIKQLLDEVEDRVMTCKPSVIEAKFKYSEGGGYDLEPSKSLADRNIEVNKAKVSCAAAQLEVAYIIARENQARIESCTIKETWLKALMVAYALGIKNPQHAIHLHVPETSTTNRQGEGHGKP